MAPGAALRVTLEIIDGGDGRDGDQGDTQGVSSDAGGGDKDNGDTAADEDTPRIYSSWGTRGSSEPSRGK